MQKREGGKANVRARSFKAKRPFKKMGEKWCCRFLKKLFFTPHLLGGKMDTVGHGEEVIKRDKCEKNKSCRLPCRMTTSGAVK
jgi:hypothetical protein